MVLAPSSGQFGVLTAGTGSPPLVQDGSIVTEQLRRHIRLPCCALSRAKIDSTSCLFVHVLCVGEVDAIIKCKASVRVSQRVFVLLRVSVLGANMIWLEVSGRAFPYKYSSLGGVRVSRFSEAQDGSWVMGEMLKG